MVCMSAYTEEHGEGKSRLKIVVSIVAIVVAIYVAAAPYITVHQIKDAAKRQDGEALSEHIDFPSVRQSFKDQANAAFAKEVLEDKKLRGSPYADIGMAIVGVMVERLVDAYVTPAGITMLMSGDFPDLEDDKDSGKSNREPLSDASMSYESLNKFVVKVENENGGEARLVLRRQGIGWRITDIIVPQD